MIFKHLFLQYNNDTGPTWGSRFMKRCGELVIGSPHKNGIPQLRKDLNNGYFYIKEDRNLPRANLMDWQIQSILVAQLRNLEAPQVARATFFGLLPVIFICVALAAPFNGSLDKSIDEGTAGKSGSMLSNVFGNKMTVEKCQAFIDKINAGEMTADEIPNAKAVVAECETLMRDQ